MIFNSFEFAVFLPIVFSIYWIIGGKRVRIQNLFMLISSYVFYGWWDIKFLALIIFSSLIDYSVGRMLEKEDKELRRKFLLAISLLVNLGLLGFFKYYNFFIENFIEIVSFFGRKPDINTISIILPVGISFYTFQTLSYSIDVYRKKIKATSDLIAFCSYVSFFPQLVAGPIERASSLLPQFLNHRVFKLSIAKDGLRQILWGLFKKVVIADTCSIYANEIFSNHAEVSSPTLLLGAVYFAFQIYGDFSGYSDIAIGTAKLFGINLMKNFAFPYFSRDIAEFWRRWHISLSTWFRDYLYIPLGGSRGGKSRTIFNIFMIFIVSGFWHGANWTFIIWGALNAIYFLPLFILDKNRENLDIIASQKFFPSFKELRQLITTFFITIIAWIFFRAQDLNHAIEYLSGLFSFQIFPIQSQRYEYVPLIILLIVWEWFMRNNDHGLAFKNLKIGFRWLIYLFMIWLILFYFGEEKEFIYFQF